MNDLRRGDIILVRFKVSTDQRNVHDTVRAHGETSGMSATINVKDITQRISQKLRKGDSVKFGGDEFQHTGKIIAIHEDEQAWVQGLSDPSVFVTVALGNLTLIDTVEKRKGHPKSQANGDDFEASDDELAEERRKATVYLQGLKGDCAYRPEDWSGGKIYVDEDDDDEERIFVKKPQDKLLKGLSTGRTFPLTLEGVIVVMRLCGGDWHELP